MKIITPYQVTRCHGDTENRRDRHAAKVSATNTLRKGVNTQGQIVRRSRVCQTAVS